jgi:catechol 2,3-dioxygenase-like lactoylglutathione lyase family enzyme
MFQRIDTVIVRVRALEQAKDWYARVLELGAIYEDAAERLAVLSTAEGSSSLTLWELKPGEVLAPLSAVGTHPIFAVADAAEAHRTLQDRGVEAEALQSGEGVRFFSFRDPDGNRLEACQILA